MKRFAIAGFAACIAGPAFAQSSVTLYGIIDTGVEYVTHANAQGDSIVRMPSITGELPSRWGLRGNEDLGGGLQAVFVLENGFNPGSGSLGQGGQIVRPAVVGWPEVFQVGYALIWAAVLDGLLGDSGVRHPGP